MINQSNPWSHPIVLGIVFLQVVFSTMEVADGFSGRFGFGALVSIAILSAIFGAIEFYRLRKIGSKSISAIFANAIFVGVLIVGMYLNNRVLLDVSKVKDAIRSYKQTENVYPKNLELLIPKNIASIPYRRVTKWLGVVGYHESGHPLMHCLGYQTFPGTYNRYCFESDTLTAFGL